MASREEYENAAKIKPSNRTVTEQNLAREGVELGVGDSRNLDVAAKREERIYGK